jgi:hypothetical protein
MNQLMLLRLTKLLRKMTGIYAPNLRHYLDCRPGGGSQKTGYRCLQGSASAGNSEVNPDSERIPTERNTTRITM